MTSPTMIWCESERCRRLARIEEWVRVLLAVRVVSRENVIGYVSVLKHRPCDEVSAVPVRVGKKGDQAL